MTKIEWTWPSGYKGESWNPIRARNRKTGKIGWHCAHVNEACVNCYAEAMNRRLGTGMEYKPGHLANGDVEIFLDEAVLTKPLRWKSPRCIFVHSMTDSFADFVEDEWLDTVFAVAALRPQHIFIMLTKRPKRMREYCASLPSRAVTIAQSAVDLGVWDDADGVAEQVCNHIDAAPIPNVWLGTSVHDQPSADEFIPELLATPAAVHFVSYEPALGAVDLTRYLGEDRSRESVGLSWVIAGGESGPNARPAHPDWFRRVRDDCAASSMAFFFKQVGEWAWQGPHNRNAIIDVKTGKIVAQANQQLIESGLGPGHLLVTRIGKRRAGRLLDGREHSEFPRCL